MKNNAAFIKSIVMSPDKFTSFWILFMLSRNGFIEKIKDYLAIVKQNTQAAIYFQQVIEALLIASSSFAVSKARQSNQKLD
jgi:hypothetical protein